MGISVVIATLNEEKNIARAIKSALFADEIVVVDSASKDRTVEVAQSFGPKIRVITHPWQGYGEQKNYAADLCTQEWIFSLDADEEISPELQQSILFNVAQNPPTAQVWRAARLTNYCGHWVKYGGWYPDFQERLWKKNCARWSMPKVHERLLPLDTSAKVASLRGNILHYSFPTYRDQLVTNTNFSHRAALDYLAKNPAGPHWPEIILRPVWKFFEAYLLKAGWGDGPIGYFIAINSAHAMFSKLAQAYLIKRGRS